MDNLRTLTFHKTRRIGRITLNRPERDNGITLEMPAELAECVEKANLDPEVHVIALFGTGKGFCGGYDLIAAAEQRTLDEGGDRWPRGSPMDTCVQLENHMPDRIWDPITKSCRGALEGQIPMIRDAG